MLVPTKTKPNFLQIFIFVLSLVVTLLTSSITKIFCILEALQNVTVLQSKIKTLKKKKMLLPKVQQQKTKYFYMSVCSVVFSYVDHNNRKSTHCSKLRKMMTKSRETKWSESLKKKSHHICFVIFEKTNAFWQIWH